MQRIAVLTAWLILERASCDGLTQRAPDNTVPTITEPVEVPLPGQTRAVCMTLMLNAITQVLRSWRDFSPTKSVGSK